MNLDTESKVTLEERMRRLIRHVPIPAGLRLKWTRLLTGREFQKEIDQAKERADRDEVERLESGLNFEMTLLYEDQELLYTKRLLRKAGRLRVPVPSRPKYVGDFQDEKSEDWQQGPQGSWSLTDKGIAKIREEIRKEEKWRREGRANWAVVLSALGGVIGALIGLVALLRR